MFLIKINITLCYPTRNKNNEIFKDFLSPTSLPDNSLKAFGDTQGSTFQAQCC